MDDSSYLCISSCTFEMDIFFLLCFLSGASTYFASVITPRMPLPTVSTILGLQARQTTSFATTCGFLNGNANQPLVANSGSQCTYDTTNTLWGICRTGISLTDCGFGGYCVDSATCSTGCGSTGTDVNTFSWYVKKH